MRRNLLLQQTMIILALALATSAYFATGLRHKSHPTNSVINGQYGSDKISIADDAFEEYIIAQMDEWQVPGLAIAIIEGNKTWSKVSLDDQSSKSNREPTSLTLAPGFRICHSGIGTCYAVDSILLW
jgi:hypothetical protein